MTTSGPVPFSRMTILNDVFWPQSFFKQNKTKTWCCILNQTKSPIDDLSENLNIEPPPAGVVAIVFFCIKSYSPAVY